MDSSTYTNLTGKTLSTSQASRLSLQSKLAKRQLQRLVGYPLNPNDWDNQYTESGKTDGCFCTLTDETELEPADDVVNAYRFFWWEPRDLFLPIDPATKIHAVKLVRDTVTLHTIDTDEYRPQWENDCDEPFVRYLALTQRTIVWHSCYRNAERVQVAVDADWGFESCPLELKKVWAEMIADSFDTKKDIKSETALTHSYTKFGPTDAVTTYKDVISFYAGPNGQGSGLGVL